MSLQVVGVKCRSVASSACRMTHLHGNAGLCPIIQSGPKVGIQ